jgi:hypothetical protein
MKVMKLNYENLFLTRYGYAQSRRCVLCLRPFVPLRGSILASTGAASPSVPLRASRSATAPEQGFWRDRRLCYFCVSPEGDDMV